MLKYLLLAVLVAALGAVDAPPRSQPQGEPRNQLRNARDVLWESNAIFLDGSLSVQQEVSRLIGLLAREVASPSPPPTGRGVGSCTSEYVQSHIIIRFRFLPAPGLLHAIKAATPAHCSPSLRQLIAVARGMAGDKSAVPEVIAVLESHPSGYIREVAAHALGNIGDPAAVPALEKALSDRFTVTRWEGPMLDKYPVIYTVRREAAMALSRMGFQIRHLDFNAWEVVGPPPG